jgi:uncharacterized protein YukE
VYQTTYNACESLNELTDALGGVLSEIAADYREQEEEHGKDFSHIDDDE